MRPLLSSPEVPALCPDGGSGQVLVVETLKSTEVYDAELTASPAAAC